MYYSHTPRDQALRKLVSFQMHKIEKFFRFAIASSQSPHVVRFSKYVQNGPVWSEGWNLTALMCMRDIALLRIGLVYIYIYMYIYIHMCVRRVDSQGFPRCFVYESHPLVSNLIFFANVLATRMCVHRVHRASRNGCVLLPPTRPLTDQSVMTIYTCVYSMNGFHRASKVHVMSCTRISLLMCQDTWFSLFHIMSCTDMEFIGLHNCDCCKYRPETNQLRLRPHGPAQAPPLHRKRHGVGHAPLGLESCVTRAVYSRDPCPLCAAQEGVLQRVAVHCSVLQCAAVCYSVLQCVAVCCSVLQCVAVCCGMLRT